MVKKQIESEITQTFQATKMVIPFEPQSLLANEGLCIWALCRSPTAMTSFAVYRDVVRVYLGGANMKERASHHLNPLPSALDVPGNEKMIRGIVAELKARYNIKVPNVRTVSRILDDFSTVGWIMKRENIHSMGSKKKMVYWLPTDVREKAILFYKETKVMP